MSEFLQREREKARKRGAAAQDLKKTGKRQAKAGRAKRRGKAGGVARSDFDEPPEPPAPLAELPGAGFVTLTTVLQFLGGVSRKTLRYMINAGFFPPPDMLIGGRWPRWSVQTLRRFENKPPKTMPPLKPPKVQASLSGAHR